MHVAKLFQVVDINEFVDDGIDCQAGCGMDVQFGGDMLTVRNDGMHGDTEHIRDFFVAQAAYDLNQHVFLAFG